MCNTLNDHLMKTQKQVLFILIGNKISLHFHFVVHREYCNLIENNRTTGKFKLLGESRPVVNIVKGQTSTKDFKIFS